MSSYLFPHTMRLGDAGNDSATGLPHNINRLLYPYQHLVSYTDVLATDLQESWRAEFCVIIEKLGGVESLGLVVGVVRVFVFPAHTVLQPIRL